MEKKVLLLDDLKAPIKYLSESINREIHWVETGVAARGELETEPERYSALLVEPFVYWKYLSAIGELQELMTFARDKKFPVIVYSTETETEVNEDFKLQKGVHYDAYVEKGVPCSPKQMKTTLDELIK